MSNRGFKNMSNKYVKAIGLLELMLSLAIIAVLLIMATRYYSSASSSSKIQGAVDQVNAIRSAVQNATAGASSASAGSLTIGYLVAAGYLPLSFVDAASVSAAETLSTAISPYGTSVGMSATATGLTISMDTPNKQTCEAIANKVNATSQSQAASCSSGALSVSYTMGSSGSDNTPS